MNFLSIDEIVHLQKILRVHPHIGSAKMRPAVLKMCGLADDLVNLSTDGSPDAFLTQLFAEFDITFVAKSGNHALIDFLAYLYPESSSLRAYKITQEEKQFLTEVIRRCKEWYKPASSAQHLEHRINAALAQQEQLAGSNSAASSRITRFDTQTLISYDLDILVGNFADRIVPGPVSAFTLAGEYDMLKDYVLERMYQRFSTIIQPHSYQSMEISLNRCDARYETIIKDKMLHEYKCQSGNIDELLLKYPGQDFVLLIWDYGLPVPSLRAALSSFWSEIERNLLALLKAKGLYFVIVLAHLGPNTKLRNLEYFTPLRLQDEKFMKSALEPWLGSTLQRLSVEPDDMRHCIDMLYPDATPIQHYRQLGRMIEYLRGRSIV